MAKEKKEKKKKSKVKGGFFGRLGRKSTAEPSNEKEVTVQTPENGGQAVKERRKTKARRDTRIGGLFKSSGSKESDDKKKDKKGDKKGGKGKVAPGQTSYSVTKPKLRKKKAKKAKKKKPEIVIKRGNQKRDPDKFFPGTVSYKYTSPKEQWVAYLGRSPEVNDYGNGARLMLDETDK